MHTFLLVFEFLGTTELLVIAVVALILFGPRKLPEIGRSVGRSLAEFKRASDDFKRTWEYEVEIDRRKPDSGDPAPATAAVASSDTTAALPSAVAEDFVGDPAARPDADEPTVARGAAATHETAAASDAYADEGAWDIATGHAGSSTQRPDRPAARADKDEVNAS